MSGCQCFSKDAHQLLLTCREGRQRLGPWIVESIGCITGDTIAHIYLALTVYQALDGVHPFVLMIFL